ncbi:hypothetical protein [Pseudomonas chlororaphis]|uniref:Uncharacterized protein n=1 Tax=Pseudomonas chlororaphis O6 TaxID=1037915 RepID=A0AB33WT88_9PSED|nr:hypothetical protein [Pseudomonas chlororaphis]EIM16316.1 hypothetical protein PchlO6_1218 [Pseudomonas chlororaphis O6]
MNRPIPKSKRPIPARKPKAGLEPFRLYGSFNNGLSQLSVAQVVEEFLRRVEQTIEPEQRVMQAQRTIGALMGLFAFNAPGAGYAHLHKDVFARLSALTGETTDHLVTMAGVAR